MTKAYLLPVDFEDEFCNPNNSKFDEDRFMHFAETDGEILSLQTLEQQMNNDWINTDDYYIIFR